MHLAHDIDLVAAAGHMHAHGLEVEAMSAVLGQLYITQNWHQPEMKVFDPPSAQGRRRRDLLVHLA